MQLILLSGGSGKRLWPLSNNTRSKQFLPLLEKQDGNMESMVQQVVRQIREAKLTNEITLATNASQLDIISKQLGDTVYVVSEPERRDTFPAIALAVSYLKYVNKCNDNEVVIVMPCDPFTEAGYFNTIGKMAHCIEQNVADLVLMGITPTYPSAKYGYIVPVTDLSNNEKDYKRVQRFIEKPTVDVAEELLKQGALWNGGVFGFRLGYMNNIIRQYSNFETFEDIKAHYSVLPKISFDYEIVEKTHSVAVIPFTGSWKDLGTWNTITDELHKCVIGNAVVGKHCKNTHIINELPHPIYVDGLEDIVVATSPDGIIICKKCFTEDIKNEVDNLISRPMYEERRWGTYRVVDDAQFTDGHHALTKILTINAGCSTSYQSTIIGQKSGLLWKMRA